MLGILDVAQNDLQTQKTHIPRDSGAWLAREKGFAAWVEATASANDPRFYWLVGLPGCGKSVLSTIVANQLQADGRLVQHHFFSEAHQEKRTVAYGLRSIATQLALGNETFRKALISLHQDTGLSFNSQDQNVHNIWETVFEGIIFKLRFSQPLIWVLDGIDESDTPDLLLVYLFRIQAQTPVKVFFSSRPLNPMSRFDSAQIRIHLLREEDTAEDIRKYATSVIRQALPDDDHLLSDIVDQTVRNSSGSFLWAKLALDALQENWHTQDDIRTVLTELPNGMVPMYKRMLGRVESQNQRSRSIARIILTWASCSWRPLGLEELRVALEPEFSGFTNLESTVTQVCGHFATAAPAGRGKQVTLIHKTARDFLFRGDPGNGAGPFIDLREGHCHLASVCLRYLSSDQWRRHFDSVRAATQSQSQPGTNAVSNRLLVAEDKHPLIGYAACYWAYHVSRSPVLSPELLDALKTFLSKYFLSWVEAVSLSGNLRHLTRSAQYLKAYAKRHSQFWDLESADQLLPLKTQPRRDVEWIQGWAVDIIRIVGTFGSGLICDPSTVYRHLPAFCPRKSMVKHTYGSSKQGSLTVSGLKAGTWSDCLASVSTGQDDYAYQVLTTETYFVTLVSSAGTVVVWDAETCEQVRAICAGSYVPLMALNKVGTSVATVTLENYNVWELLTGRQLYTCARSSSATVLDLRFGEADHDLFVCLNSNAVHRIDLRSGEGVEHCLPLPADSDFSYQTCPWRMALSQDLSKVASAWRGRPPLIWDLIPDATPAPRTCRVASSLDSICGPELLRWHPVTGSLFILCQNARVVEWRVYEHEHQEWEHISAREMVISDDGEYLLSSDYAGTISIWAIPDLNLVYRLINDGGSVSDLAFSPISQRFYDLRGAACNVWEPDVLVRSEEVEEDGSSMGGTDLVAESTISQFDVGGELVTALALDAGGRYYCTGREDGRVAIHDVVTGERLRRVYAHRASCAVLMLCWSETGKYMASCDDGGYVVAKRLQVKKEGAWGVFPVFEFRLEETVRQLMFSGDERLLLVTTASGDYVWDLKGKKETAVRKWVGWRGGMWVLHPARGDLLIWVELDGARCYKWLDLKGAEGAAEDCSDDPDDPDHSNSSGDSDDSGKLDSPEGSAGLRSFTAGRGKRRRVTWASTTPDKQSIIYATVPDDGTYTTSYLPYTDLRLHSVAISTPQGTSQPTRHAPGVSARVKYFLGTHKHDVVFLDHDSWLCTWNPRDGAERIARHFFVPKDWVNTGVPCMAAVIENGTVFWPRFGEVAVVRNGIRV